MSLFGGMYALRFHVAPFISEDARGDVEHGEPVEAPCGWEANNRLVRDGDGDQVVASGTIFTPHPVGERDLVYPPGVSATDESKARRVLTVAPRYLPFTNLVDHYEVTY